MDTEVIVEVVRLGERVVENTKGGTVSNKTAKEISNCPPICHPGGAAASRNFDIPPPRRLGGGATRPSFQSRSCSLRRIRGLRFFIEMANPGR